MKTFTDYLEQINTAIDAGFTTKASQKRAMDLVNRAYDMVREEAHNAVIDFAWGTFQHYTDSFQQAARCEIFEANDLPFNLHQVRSKHFKIFEEFGVDSMERIELLLGLRDAVKMTEVVKVPTKNEELNKVEAEVRKTISEEFKRIKKKFLGHVDVAKHFGGLCVSVTAHMCYMNNGTQYIRCFYYLDHKFTSLGMIMAVAAKLEEA